MKKIKSILLCFCFVAQFYSSQAQCNHPDDVAALQSIFNALGGPQWYTSSTLAVTNRFCTFSQNGEFVSANGIWNFQDPNIDLSTWHSVVCNAQGRIERLFLAPQDYTILNGSLPPEIKKLTYLKSLEIYPCVANPIAGAKLNITGPLPLELKDLVYLETLRIKQVKFGASLPDIFQNMTNIQEITFLNCKLINALPDYFFQSLINKQNLHTIDLYFNEFNGPIPFNITQLSQDFLKLNLSYNYFTGTVYPELGGLNFQPGSFGLNLGFNNLSGCIPESIQNLCPLNIYFDSGHAHSTWQSTVEVPYSPNTLDFADRQSFCNATIDCEPVSTNDPSDNDPPEVIVEITPIDPPTKCAITNDKQDNFQIRNFFSSSSLLGGNAAYKVDIKRFSDVHIDQSGNKFVGVAVKNGTYSEIQIFKNNSKKVTLKGNHNCQISEITTDDNGGVYITGAFKSEELAVQNSSINKTIIGNCNPVKNVCLTSFVAKFNAGFTSLEWFLPLVSSFKNSVEDIAIISPTEFAITGTLAKKTNFDPHFTNTENVSNDGSSAYVAKYNVVSSKPKLKWVRTIYSTTAKKADVLGFGISYDKQKYLYVTGSWKTISGYTGLSINTANTPFQVNWPASPKSNTFVIGYDTNGSFRGIDKATNHVSGTSNNVYAKDIAFYKNQLYTVGLNGRSIFKISNGVPKHANTFVEMNNNYQEIEVNENSCNNGSLFTIGRTSKGFIRVFDSSFNSPQKEVLTNGGGYRDGLSISTYKGEILAGFGYNGSPIQQLAPNPLAYPYSGQGNADFLLTTFRF
jgi:hypothetical protein